MKRCLVFCMILALLFLSACAPNPVQSSVNDENVLVEGGDPAPQAPTGKQALPEQYRAYRDDTYVEAEIGKHVLMWEGKYSDEKKSEAIAVYEESCTPIVIRPGQSISFPATAEGEFFVSGSAYGYENEWDPYDMPTFGYVHEGEVLLFDAKEACYVLRTMCVTDSQTTRYCYYIRVMEE